MDGTDVSGRTTFTASEFAQLTYTAGASGAQNLVVVAQTGTRTASGTLSHVIDSPAVQITANVTGSRSINAYPALVTTPTGADANVADVVQEAGIFDGFGGTTARPSLDTALTPVVSVPLANLAGATGAFASSGIDRSASAVDLSTYYPDAIGGSVATGQFAAPGGAVATALLLLDDTAAGAWQEAGDNGATTATAIRAYTASQAI